jgi:hypothetical protein
MHVGSADDGPDINEEMTAIMRPDVDCFHTSIIRDVEKTVFVVAPPVVPYTRLETP